MFTLLYECVAFLLICTLMRSLYVFGTMGLLVLFMKLEENDLLHKKVFALFKGENLELFQQFVIFMYWVFAGCFYEGFWFIIGLQQPWHAVLLASLKVSTISLSGALIYMGYAKLGLDAGPRLARLTRR
jgi:hypothetical protein